METLTCDWGKLAWCQTPGDDPAIIFLHGTGCDCGDFAAVSAAMRRPARRLALDFRGHGASDTPTGPMTLSDLASDVLLLMDKLHLGPVVLAGHSLGGMVALDVARRGGDVLGLVLLEGWTNLKGAGAFAPDRYYGGLGPDAIAAIKAKSEAMRARFTAANWQIFWQSAQVFDAFDYLRRATIPVLEVYGARGCRDHMSERLCVPENPHIQWAWVADAGHYLPTEAPARVAALCDRFLATALPPSAHATPP